MKIWQWISVLVLALATVIAMTGVEAWSMSRKDIRRSIHTQRDAFQVCYNTALEKYPKMRGRTELTWDINDKGEAKNIRIRQRLNRLVDGCLAKVLSEIKFPRAPKGKTISLRYPFDFDQAPFDKNDLRKKTRKKVSSKKKS